MKTAVAIDTLSHTFGSHAVLKGLSFSITAGDFFIIIGPNGSGKTTLMKLMAGVLKTKAGRIRIFDRDIRSFSYKSLARRIAYVPQRLEVGFPFTVEEAVLMGRAPHQNVLGIPQDQDIETAYQAMAITEVSHLAGRKLDQLSGGEQQRVFIARALCQEPEIILLDEPTASLDLSHQVRVMDLMEKLKTEKQVTVVMVSHDVNLAAMYGDRLLLLKDGDIACLGLPFEVLTFQNLEATYGCKLLVDESPLGNVPRVTPVPQKFLNRKEP
ncbi:MAG: ABC transporter ATP-binding protein [Desulfobacterales bacterium]